MTIQKQLQGQDLARFIQQNPGANVKINSGASQLAQMLPSQITQPQQKGGFLSSVVKTFTDPFINSGRGILELGNQALGGESGRFLNEEEMRDPLGFALKNAAGVGSFLLPGGVGLKGALAAGGASGALGGLSQSNLSDPGDIAENVLTGGVLGGATGGVLNKLFGKAGKAVNQVDNLAGQADNATGVLAGIRNKGKNIERGLTGIKTPKTPTGAIQADNLADDFLGLTSARGFKPDADGMAKTFNAISDDLGKTLSASKANINKQNILTDFIEKTGLEADMTSSVVDKNVKLWTNKIAQLGDNPTPQQLATLKREVQGQLSPVFKKLRMGNPLSEAEIVRLQFHNSIDDAIKTAVPEAAPLYKQLSTLHDVAPDIVTNASKSGYISAPFFTNIKVPTLGIDRAAKSTAAKAMQGRIPGLSGAGKVATPLQRFIRTGTAIQGTNTSQDPQELPINNALNEGIAQEQLQYQQQIQAIQQEIEMAKQSYVVELVRAGMSPEEAMASAEATYGASGGGEADIKRTEKQTQFYNAAGSAQRALDLLDSGQVGSGKAQAVKSKVTNFLGTTSDLQTDYKSNIALARSLAINALAGANQSPQEVARIADSIPNESDEPEIAKQKLRSFIQQMQAFSNG